MAIWLKDLFQEYLEEELKEKIRIPMVSRKPPVIGGVYFGGLKTLDKSKPNKPLYFLVVRRIDKRFYEVFKVSDWHLFASHRDVIIKLPEMTLMVETGNNFYLTEAEIKRFLLISSLPEDEVNKIKKFRSGRKVEGLKKGFEPIFSDDIRNKFSSQEFELIKEFHMRLFTCIL